MAFRIIEVKLDDLIARIDDHFHSYPERPDPEIMISIKACPDTNQFDDFIKEVEKIEVDSSPSSGRVAQVRSKFGEAFFVCTWETDPHNDAVTYTTLERKVPLTLDMTPDARIFMDIIDKLGVTYTIRTQSW